MICVISVTVQVWCILKIKLHPSVISNFKSFPIGFLQVCTPFVQFIMSFRYGSEIEDWTRLHNWNCSGTSTQLILRVSLQNSIVNQWICKYQESVLIVWFFFPIKWFLNNRDALWVLLRNMQRLMEWTYGCKRKSHRTTLPAKVSPYLTFLIWV